VQLVGKESLSEDQKVVMEIAKILREDFLQQNAFTDYDYTCPLNKSIGMLRCTITLYTCCQKAIQDSPADQKVTWAQIKTAFGGPADSPNGIIQKVIETKFLMPKDPDLDAKYMALCDEVKMAFQNFTDAL